MIAGAVPNYMRGGPNDIPEGLVLYSLIIPRHMGDERSVRGPTPEAQALTLPEQYDFLKL